MSIASIFQSGTSMFQSGTKKVRKVVKTQQRAMAKRALSREKKQSVDLESRIQKAGQERAKLIQRRKLYEAQLGVKQEREVMNRTRRSAGQYTVGERVSGALGATGRSGASFYKGLATSVAASRAASRPAARPAPQRPAYHIAGIEVDD